MLMLSIFVVALKILNLYNITHVNKKCKKEVNMKVAIYVRVSTTEQVLEGYSIPAQITTLKHYCTGFQYIVYKVYHDAGISGKNIKDRPSLLQLIEDAKANKFDAVLVWKLSRLSRSLLDLLSIVDIFTKHNIAFISYSEKFDTTTPTGKMLLQMLGSIAEFERNTIIENVKLGLNERFQQGYSKGSVPFGYTYQDKKAVIVPEQAAIVKYIFETYYNSEDGNCLTDLADYLNTNNYRTRLNGLWNRVSVRDMLNNHFYAGYVRTGIFINGKRNNNITIQDGQHQAIIDKELFQAISEKLSSKKHANIKNPNNSSLVTGLITCPLCGNKMIAHWSTKPYKKNDGTIVQYDNNFYKCISHKPQCRGFYISAKKIDPKIIEMLNRFKGKRFINSLVKKIKKISKQDIKPINNQVEIIEKQLKDAYNVRDRYFKLFETGKVDIEKFSDKINEILQNIDQLEKLKNEELQDNIDYSDDDILEILIESLNNINTLEKLSNQGKKELVRTIIKEVKINESKEFVSVIMVSGLEFFYS